MIIEKIKCIAVTGIAIPKLEAKEKFTIKGWGKRRGEDALVYIIPNTKNPQKHNEKGITVSEFEKAYKQLCDSGELTKVWFNKHLGKCANEGSCNFTSLGGIFELLGEAKYEHRCVYKRRQV